jgi:pyruvate dehydrogenase E2 component (dihydrolipoamide acetyltransferase)
VTRGDIVAVVDTDKADVDVEVFESGTVHEILVPVGERVPVGTPLALIGTGAAAPREPATAPTDAPPVPAVIARLARHLKVDLAAVTGTGPGGEITRADVEAAAVGPAAGASEVAAPAPAPAPAAVGEARSMRQVIADVMTKSKREIPHYYVAHDIDVGAMTDLLTQRNLERPVSERVLPAAYLLKAVALAARQVPDLNGTWVDRAFHPADHVHLGVAIRLREGGLVAPAILDADTLSVEDLMRRLQDLVGRVRSGGLRGSELSAPTITVTQLGDQGVDSVIGVINPPQVAMVGLGRPRERPWAVNGMLCVRPVVTATLAADHRATDGIVGARFLSTLDRLLQKPEEL